MFNVLQVLTLSTMNAPSIIKKGRVMKNKDDSNDMVKNGN